MAFKKPWRDAATLIMLSRQSVKGYPADISRKTNYDILFQKRSQNVSSFPNSLVFPGGVTEESDSSEKWFKLIKSFGFKQEDFDLLWSPGCKVTPIFQDDPLRRHISLRITAIREVFEELGILICRKNKERTLWANALTGLDLKYWQNKVHNSSIEFLSLCEEMQCYPDIWSLYYWSNWLTPTVYKNRFDTAFFISAFQDRPQVSEDKKEVAEIRWTCPEEILEKNKQGLLELLPPQVYEMSRLSHIEDLTKLIEFCSKRSVLGCDEIHFPVNLIAIDGVVSLLPGDDLYPKNVDLIKGSDEDFKKTSKGKTVAELRDNCVTLNRFETTINEGKKSRMEFVIQNLRPTNHIRMDSANLGISGVGL